MLVHSAIIGSNTELPATLTGKYVMKGHTYAGFFFQPVSAPADFTDYLLPEKRN